MKKINKYFNQSELPSLKEGLSLYNQMTSSFQNEKGALSVKKSSPLSLIIPFAAASLSVIGANAQCGATVTQEAPNNGEIDFFVDVDNDGTDDIEIAVQGGDLIAFLLTGNIEVAAAPSGAYRYATRFETGDVISSGNANWLGMATRNFATMAYSNSAGPQWNGGQSGFLGIRLNGNQLGFVQATWNPGANTVSVDASLSGVQDPAGAAADSDIQAAICSALPVELTRFNGQRKDNVAQLNWSTASENNNKGFEIQRSKDGTNFMSIGFVNGQGNSNTQIEYSFDDKSVRSTQKYYYRLKQIDFWGTYEMSEIIALEASERPTVTLGVSPNPSADNFVNVSFTADKGSQAILSIFDIKGQLMSTTKVQHNDSSNQQLDISELPAGSYFIKLEQSQQVEYVKFIKN